MLTATTHDNSLGMDNGRLWRELGQCYCMCVLLVASALPGRDDVEQCPGHFISLASDSFDKARKHLGDTDVGAPTVQSHPSLLYWSARVLSWQNRHAEALKVR